MHEDQAIAAAEDQREHYETDPIREMHLEATQNRYERWLGWGVD